MTQKTHTSNANIVEEDMAPKRAQKKNITRIQQEKAMMNIASRIPNQLQPSFWKPQLMVLNQIQSWCNSFSSTSQPDSLLNSSILNLRQSKLFSSHSQFKKYCHHLQIIHQDPSQVQETTI
jgi:hypothetical protein